MPPADTLLDLPLRTPPVVADIEEEDDRNRDDLPSDRSKKLRSKEGIGRRPSPRSRSRNPASYPTVGIQHAADG
jgi:hypothetical protein